jgi:hypothetical protein
MKISNNKQNKRVGPEGTISGFNNRDITELEQYTNHRQDKLVLHLL